MALCLLTAISLASGTANATSDNPLSDVSGGTLNTTAGDAQVGTAASNLLDGDEEKDHREDFIIVPIPGVNPTIGASLALAAAYFYTLDEGSQASYTGVGGFASTNGSLGWGITQSISWLNDRLRARAVVGSADVRYNLYGIGSSGGSGGLKLPIDQTAKVYSAQAAYNVGDEVFLGIKGRYLDSTLSFDVGAAIGVPGLPNLDLDVTSGVAGPTIEIDRRDSQFAPRNGFQLTMESMFSFAQSIDRYEFHREQAAVNYFVPMFSDDTIAIRAAGCHFGGQGPFFEECLLGAADGLRGYPVGQYIDKALFSAQVEYRGRINETWGYVGFAGFGVVAPRLSALVDRQPLPSAGAGIRYRVSQKNQLDLSIDTTISNDDTALYIYVGQSF